MHDRATIASLPCRFLLSGLTASLLLAAPVDAKKPKAPPSADELVIVDCLLPHKTRRLGKRATFLIPRKPIRTTAVDCRIRGGEHTEPDQASLATALAVWKPQAAAGDAEAQYYVGQIYEKGLGAPADPAAAATWYRKAAEQGYRAAQVGLGYLYEEGIGVEADEAEALRWYRRAAGQSEDLVVLAERDYAALVEARDALEGKSVEVDALRGQVGALEKQIKALEQASDAEQTQHRSLSSLLERLRVDLTERELELEDNASRIAALESRADTPSAPAATRPSADIDMAGLPFGHYHALVIGNSNYQALPSTPTAVPDARAIADLLRERYDFEVNLLIDATRYDIMSALNKLRADLTEADHLLVYYAGHGVRDAEGETAYWQGVDADPKSPANWIPSAVVTEHLDIIPARHVFVVADSVYSGLRTRSSIARLPQGMTDEQRYFHIKGLLERKARLVLAAGTEQPVTERTADQDRSRFSSTLIDVLRGNQGVLEASSLYFEVNRRLAEGDATPRLSVDFATLKWARNDLGEFFFVPKSG